MWHGISSEPNPTKNRIKRPGSDTNDGNVIKMAERERRCFDDDDVYYYIRYDDDDVYLKRPRCENRESENDDDVSFGFITLFPSSKKKNAWATLTETCVARGNQGCCHEASVDCGEEATCHSCIYLTVLPSKLRRREQQHDRR